MAHVFKKIYSYHRVITLIGTPLLLLPLPLIVSGKEADAAFIVILMAVYWVTEALPMAVTSLLPVVLAPAMGIMSTNRICPAYMKDINMIFIGSLMIATGIEHRNLHTRIALMVLTKVGANPKMLLLGFMIPSWFLSMWINNTSTTAMMLPIVDAVVGAMSKQTVQNTEEDETEVTMEMGDNVMYDKTPLKSFNYGSFHLDGGSKHGPPVAFHSRVAPLDVNTTVTNKNPVKKEYDSLEESVQENPEVLRLRQGLYLGIAYASTTGGIATLTGTNPNMIFYGFVNDLYGNKAGVNFGTWIGYGLPISIVMVIITWVMLMFMFLGVKQMFHHKKNPEEDTRIKQIIKSELTKLGPLSFAEGSCIGLFSMLVLLWLTREPGFPGWGSLFTDSEGNSYVRDSQPAILIAILFCMWPERNPFKTKTDDYLVYGSGVLVPWKVIQHHVPWGIGLLLGGGLALAEICKESGLSELIGQQLTFLQNFPVPLVVILLATCTAFITEVASNTATANIILPITLALAPCLNTHPLKLGFTTAIACSLSFCLPVATPPNAIVFSKKALTVAVMARSGVLLNIVGVITASTATLTYGSVIFGMFEIPSWANNCTSLSNSTNS